MAIRNNLRCYLYQMKQLLDDPHDEVPSRLLSLFTYPQLSKGMILSDPDFVGEDVNVPIGNIGVFARVRFLDALRSRSDQTGKMSIMILR